MENKIFHYLITESSHNLNAYQNLKPTLFHHFGAIKSAFCLCNYSSSKFRKRRSNSFVESCSILFSICLLRYAASALIATRISKSVSLSLRIIWYFFIVIPSVRSSEYSITDIGKIINLANRANDWIRKAVHIFSFDMC